MLVILLSVSSVFHLYSAQVPTPPAKNGMFNGLEAFSDHDLLVSNLFHI